VNDAMPSEIMTTAEVAQYLHVHPGTLYKLIRQRQIPVFKLGADYRFFRDAIEKWITDREGPTPEVYQMPSHR
jgi:excisionase family DNA binding protein